MGAPKSVWAVILTALVACGPPPDKFSGDFIRLAEQRWEKATCLDVPHYTLRFVDGLVNCGGAGTWGCEDYGRITISREVPAHKMFEVLTHELGHRVARKLGHVDILEGIMTDSTAYSAPWITAKDLELVCEGNGCPCRVPEDP